MGQFCGHIVIYWLREFPLYAVADRFELKCQLKQLLLSYYKIGPCYAVTVFIGLATVSINIVQNQVMSITYGVC